MRTIPIKESLTIEFKSDKKKYSDADLVDEIVGMTNTKGGTLYLGVEDNGEVTGVHPKHKDAIGVTALIANSTVPSVSVRAEVITEEEKDVLKIEIPVSRTVVSTSSGKMLRRRLKADGSPEVIPMYSYEVVTRLSELALLDFSAGPLAGATIEDFDPNQRIRLRNIIQNKPGGEKNLLGLQDDELDKALRLTTEVDGKIYPTVTGMLLIGKESSIEKLMPTAKASFQVLEGTKVRVNIETSGPLLEVFEKVYAKNKKSVLLLIGDGELFEDIKQKVRDKGFEENVIFTGITNNTSKYMQAMDLFAMPSRYEGLPVVCVEAQASGLDCVLSGEITREVKFTDNVGFVDIGKENIDKWVDVILKKEQSFNDKLNSEKRLLGAQNVKNAGYEISSQAKRLEKIYIRLAHRC